MRTKGLPRSCVVSGQSLFKVIDSCPPTSLVLPESVTSADYSRNGLPKKGMRKSSHVTLVWEETVAGMQGVLVAGRTAAMVADL